MEIKKFTSIHPIAILFSIALLTVSFILLILYFSSGTLVRLYYFFQQKDFIYLSFLIASILVSFLYLTIAFFKKQPIIGATVPSEVKHKLLSAQSFFTKYKQQSLLFILVVLAVLLLIIYFGKINLGEFSQELGNKDKPFYIRNIALLLAAIGTAIFTWWKNILTQKTIEISESTRQDELFAKAVSLLIRTNDLTTRKAGVHILKDLAMTSPKHAQKCIDMLCSLNEFWMPTILKSFPDFFELNPDFCHIKDPSSLIIHENNDEPRPEDFACNHDEIKKYIDDISLSQLVLTTIPQILSHISTNIEYNVEFSLSHSYLCSINLNDFDFSKSRINLRNAYLNNSSLFSANLNGANLNHANISNAGLLYTNLNYAMLLGANLSNADLSGADFSNAYLSNADLTNAFLSGTVLTNTFLPFARINNADLTNANLEGANLTGANLEGANLDRANLTNTDFTDAILTNTNFTDTILTGAKFNGNFPSPDGKPPQQ